jgi:hypothetical protein
LLINGFSRWSVLASFQRMNAPVQFTVRGHGGIVGAFDE